jgi:hypothetical protein
VRLHGAGFRNGDIADFLRLSPSRVSMILAAWRRSRMGAG